MHILHVTPYYAPAYAFGGVVRAVEGMARALERRGHRVTVLTTDACNHDSRYNGPMQETVDGIDVFRVPNLSVWLRGHVNLSTPLGMRRLARELIPQVDLVHCHEFRTVENLLATPLAVQMGRPLVLSPHGTLALETGRGALKRLWDRLLSPALAPRFERVIALSQAEIETLQALWPSFGRRWNRPAFDIIPNGVEPDDYTDLRGAEAFREKHGLGSDLCVLYMGRLHPRKGVDVLLKAFKRADVPATRLVIAGPDEGMRAALDPLLDERVTLTGYLDGNERLAAYAAGDLFALPATGEGLSMAALEAMAAGLPVILSPGCNLPEAAAHGAGLEVEPQVEPLTEALRALLTDAERRARMGEAARQLVRARFTWDAAAAQIEAIYRTLLDAGEVQSHDI